MLRSTLSRRMTVVRWLRLESVFCRHLHVFHQTILHAAPSLVPAISNGSRIGARGGHQDLGQSASVRANSIATNGSLSFPRVRVASCSGACQVVSCSYCSQTDFVYDFLKKYGAPELADVRFPFFCVLCGFWPLVVYFDGNKKSTSSLRGVSLGHS